MTTRVHNEMHNHTDQFWRHDSETDPTICSSAIDNIQVYGVKPGKSSLKLSIYHITDKIEKNFLAISHVNQFSRFQTSNEWNCFLQHRQIMK